MPEPKPNVQPLDFLRAIRDSSLDLESSALCTAIVLRTNNKTGYTEAGVPTLARDFRLSPKTAYRRLTRLVGWGVVHRKRRRYDTSWLWVDLEALRRLRRPDADRTPKPQSPAPNSTTLTPTQTLPRGQSLGGGKGPEQTLPVGHSEVAAEAKSGGSGSPTICLTTELPLELPSSCPPEIRRCYQELSGHAWKPDDEKAYHHMIEKLREKKLPTSPDAIIPALDTTAGLATRRPNSFRFFTRSVPRELGPPREGLRRWIEEQLAALRELHVGRLHYGREELLEDLVRGAKRDGLPYRKEAIAQALDWLDR